MDTQKTQIADRLKEATNILVTISANPSVDQLTGAIGLTLLLNKLGKHATAVFSGAIPSTIQFLQPEKTLEKNTDSLRDFIIALDKSKADKLRYKVEDQMVKIFITPYMTSISDKDLEFSQGDFNVEVVLALGVHEQQDLDQAITSHGRILHDATVIGISNLGDLTLGSINWSDTAASSLCEMLIQLGLLLKADVLDGQMATAFLTGIVAETNRFSNEKTSSETMQISAKLMAAGANQQLVASQLQAPDAPADQPETEELELPQIDQQDQGESESDDEASPDKPQDGTLQIAHEGQADAGDEAETETAAEVEAETEEPEPQISQIHIDSEGMLSPTDQQNPAAAPESPQTPDQVSPPSQDSQSSRFITDPPTMGGTLTASSEPESSELATDMLGATTNTDGPLLSHDSGPATATTGDSPSAEPTSVTEPAALPQLSEDQPNPPSAEENPASPDPVAPVIVDEPAVPSAPAPPLPVPPTDQPHPQTLADLEQAVSNARVEPNVTETETSDYMPSASPEGGVDAARDAVSQAMSGTTPQILQPVQSLNAQPIDLNVPDIPAANPLPDMVADTTVPLPSITINDGAVPSDPGAPPVLTPFNPPPLMPVDPAPTGSVADPNAPPPVPPPMMPPMAPPAAQ